MNSLKKHVSSAPSFGVQIFQFQTQRLQPRERYCWHYRVQRDRKTKIYWVPTLSWCLIDMIWFNSNNHGGRGFISTSIFQMKGLRLTELDNTAQVTVIVKSGPWSGCCPSPRTFHYSTASHRASQGLLSDKGWVSRNGTVLITPSMAAPDLLKGHDSQRVKKPCLSWKYPRHLVKNTRL